MRVGNAERLPLGVVSASSIPATRSGTLRSAHAGAPTLSATLRSKAVYAQEWPMLELTLTDVADHKLAIKDFSAIDYVPKGTSGTNGTAAQTIAGATTFNNLTISQTTTRVFSFR